MFEPNAKHEQGKRYRRESGGDATHVLIVEDNVGFAYLLRDVMLRQAAAEFVVEQAGDLETALGLLETRRFDVVLLDLGLPDSGGFHTFARIKAAAQDTAIIILTVLDDDGVAMQALRGGAQDYLVKEQVDKNVLGRAVRYAMARARIEAALRRLSVRLLQVQDEERRRLARELHDVTAQSLAALAMKLSTLKTTLTEQRADGVALVDESLACAEECSREIRTMSYLLHPPLLDELGLVGTVRDYADGFAERSHVRVDLEIGEGVDRLVSDSPRTPERSRVPLRGAACVSKPGTQRVRACEESEPSSEAKLTRDIETALFRVLQEALTNIHRHAGSRTASVRLCARDGHVELEVRDSGCGIPADVLQDRDRSSGRVGVGIAGMRERLRQLGGRLDIRSSPAGTTVLARVPARSEHGQ